MRVLIAPDKFKGTLTAHQAASAMARGWKRARPTDKLSVLPICDGGDGFGAAMGALLGAKSLQLATVNAAHQMVRARWWWQPKDRTAIIESANIIGLAMLPPRKFHPFEVDTFGLGQALLTAKRKGAKRILIGIGGSATNDGAFGLARALGWRFLERNGCEITRWTELQKLAEVESGTRFKRGEILVAVDVQNSLLGPRGASLIYGPQKGLRPRDFPHAEKCLRQLANAMRRKTKTDFAKVPGAGAAGGLGFGLQAFANAKLQSGFELFASHASLDKQLRSVDLVVTGEGAIDLSTTHGKGVGELARRCNKLRLPCIGLGGVIRSSPELKSLFLQTLGMVELTSPANAHRNAGLWLTRTAQKCASNLVCK